MLGLTGIRVPAGAEGLGAGGSKEPAVDLSVGITGEVSTSRRSPYPFIQFDVAVKTWSFFQVIKPLLENPDFISKMKDLLPASEQGESGGDATAAIDSTVKSPQFKQAMAMFSRFYLTNDFFFCTLFSKNNSSQIRNWLSGRPHSHRKQRHCRISLPKLMAH